MVPSDEGEMFLCKNAIATYIATTFSPSVTDEPCHLPRQKEAVGMCASLCGSL